LSKHPCDRQRQTARRFIRGARLASLRQLHERRTNLRYCSAFQDAEYLVEPLAETQGAACDELERVVDDALPAAVKERPVAVVLVGAPFEELNDALLRHEVAKPLACPVPVDEEDEPRTESIDRMLRAIRATMRSACGMR
jgi:hypothetical protein